MSVQTEIDRISGNVAASLEAVAEMGAEVPAGANSNNLPGLIRSIQTGGTNGNVTKEASYIYGGSYTSVMHDIWVFGDSYDRQFTEWARIDNAWTYEKLLDAVVNVLTHTGNPINTYTITEDMLEVVQGGLGMYAVRVAITEYGANDLVCVYTDTGNVPPGLYWCRSAGNMTITKTEMVYGALYARTRTPEMVQPVGADEDGFLWTMSDDDFGFPAPTYEDEGKALMVVSGNPAWAAIPREKVVKKMEYNASTNNWTVTYTDNTTSTVSGPAMFSGKYSDLTGKPSSFTPSAHNQAASTITGGTFAGQVVAKAGYQAPGTSLLRNTKLVASETTPTNEGEIFWTYG